MVTSKPSNDLYLAGGCSHSHRQRESEQMGHLYPLSRGNLPKVFNAEFNRVGKGWCQLKNFHFNRGQALCLHNVWLHKGERYGRIHLVVGRNNVNGEFWVIASDEPTTLKTFQEYGLRFDIEENFLDDQSNGWNI